EEIKRQLLGEEEVESLINALKTVDTDLQNKRELQLRLNALVDVKKRLKGFEDELQQVNGQEAVLEKKAELFNSGKKIKLDQHRALTPYEVDIRNYIGFSERSTEIEKLISGLNKRINEQKEVRENLLIEITQFLNQPVDADNVVSKLNEYRDKVLRLQNDLQQKISEVKNQENSVGQLLKSRMMVEYKWNSSDANLGEKIVQTQNEVGVKISEGERKGWLPEELDSLISKGINRQEALLKLQGRINEFINLNKEVKEQEDQLGILEKELIDEAVVISHESEIESLQLNLDQLNANLLQMVQESKEGITALREGLVDNEPCPVCGSLDHPYAGHYIDRLDDHRKLIEKAKAEFKEKKDSLEKMKQLRLRVQTRIGQISELNQSKKDSLEPLKLIIETLKREAGIGEVKSVKIIEEKLSGEKDQLILMQSHQQLYLLRYELIHLADAVSRLLLLKSGESDALQHLQEFYSGKNINSDCNEFIDSFNKVNQELNSGEHQLLQRTSEQVKLKEDLDRLQQKLNSALNALGYLGIETAGNSLLNPIDLDAFSREEANLKQEETTLKTRLQQVYKSIDTERKNDQVDKSIESCIVELEEIVSSIRIAENQRNEFAGRVSANEERIKSVNRLKDEIGKKVEENRPWKLLNDLIGDRTGNKFNSFAQELTMAKLIRLTNVHLVQFNDRYILSMPSSSDEDLVIIDGYMGAERRSVKTLSGGEKFMVSLSLALSMSEMASQQVKIQSLFIDEGISTLDPETLDQVVSTLEQLQSGTQKTIGIISHVEALKDRIITQVQLEKSSTGFSTMKIV
ncbi:MAG: SbcC/MukB-like Walker B domain-containing protein, partial [Flavitalea sp.]